VAAIGANARAALVPGAGHSAHLEQPGRFAELVLPWLAAVTGGGSG
jgi:pimeloyl-ACP methyl ester carboxylesterase